MAKVRCRRRGRSARRQAPLATSFHRKPLFLPSTEEEPEIREGVSLCSENYIADDSLVLRLYTLPPTTLNQDPAKTHLAPPNVAKNFLISPPGSPPEGWEPIIEDAPNSSTLAEDLARALQAIQLNGRRRNGGKEVIFEGEGVRVEVEDCTVPEEQMDVDGLHWAGVEEAVETNQHGEVWEVPSQIRGNGTLGATHTPGLGGLGAGTPGGRIRVAPTAMPPLAE